MVEERGTYSPIMGRNICSYFRNGVWAHNYSFHKTFCSNFECPKCRISKLWKRTNCDLIELFLTLLVSGASSFFLHKLEYLHDGFQQMFPGTRHRRVPNTQRSLQWRHIRRDTVTNHNSHDCLLNRLFRCGSKKTSKLCFTGLCAGNSPGTG